jgi:hypothetical protein
MFARESHFQKTGTDGRNVERAIRYHGHRGLSGHKRELLQKVDLLGQVIAGGDARFAEEQKS